MGLLSEISVGSKEATSSHAQEWTLPGEMRKFNGAEWKRLPGWEDTFSCCSYLAATGKREGWHAF